MPSGTQTVTLPDGGTADFPADWTPGMIQSKLWDTFPQWRPKGPVQAFTPWDPEMGQGNQVVREFQSYEAYQGWRGEQEQRVAAQGADQGPELPPIDQLSEAPYVSPSKRGGPMLSELRPVMEQVAQEWGVKLQTGDELRKANPGSTLDLDAMAESSNQATLAKVRDEALARIKSGRAGEIGRGLQGAGVALGESLTDPVNLGLMAAGAAGGARIALPIYAGFIGQAGGQAAGSIAGGAPLQQKISETAIAATMLAPLVFKDTRTGLRTGVSEIATDVANLNKFLGLAPRTAAAAGAGVRAPGAPPVVQPASTAAPTPLAQLGTALVALENARLAVAESGAVPFATVNRALTNLRTQLEAAQKAARRAGARTAATGAQPAEAATGALEAGSAAPAEARDAMIAAAKKTIDDATSAALRNQTGAVDAQTVAAALNAAAAAARSFHTALGGAQPQPEQQPAQPSPAPGAAPAARPKPTTSFNRLSLDEKFEALARKAADPAAGRFNVQENAFLNQLQKDPALHKRWLERRAELVAEFAAAKPAAPEPTETAPPAAPAAAQPTEVPSASSQQQATGVHGLVPTPPVESAKEVPVQGSGGGVQPQAEGGVWERSTAEPSPEAHGIAYNELRMEGVSPSDAIGLLAGVKTVKQVVEGNFTVTPSQVAIPGGQGPIGHAEAWMEGYNQAISRLTDILARAGVLVRKPATPAPQESATLETPAPEPAAPSAPASPLAERLRQLQKPPVPKSEPPPRALPPDEWAWTPDEYLRENAGKLEALVPTPGTVLAVDLSKETPASLQRFSQRDLLRLAQREGAAMTTKNTKEGIAEAAFKFDEFWRRTEGVDFAALQRMPKDGLQYLLRSIREEYTPKESRAELVTRIVNARQELAAKRAQGMLKAKHYFIVRDAVREGIPVPQNVIDAYPELRREGAQPTQKRQPREGPPRPAPLSERWKNFDDDALIEDYKAYRAAHDKPGVEPGPINLPSGAKFTGTQSNLARLLRAMEEEFDRRELDVPWESRMRPPFGRETEPPGRRSGVSQTRQDELAALTPAELNARYLDTYASFHDPARNRSTADSTRITRELNALRGEMRTRGLEPPATSPPRPQESRAEGGFDFSRFTPDALVELWKGAFEAYHRLPEGGPPDFTQRMGRLFKSIESELQSRGIPRPEVGPPRDPRTTQAAIDMASLGAGPTARRGPQRGDPPDIAQQAVNQQSVAAGPHGLPAGIDPGPPDFAAHLMEASRRMDMLVRSSGTLPRSVLGRYVRDIEADHIVVNNVRDQRTVTHEMGHGLDARLFPAQYAIPVERQSQQTLVDRFSPHGVTGVSKGQLFRQLAAVSEFMRGPLNTAYRRRASELMADFFSLYAHDPARARAMAPDPTRGFEAALAHHPELLETVRQIHDRHVIPIPGELDPGVSSVTMVATETPDVIGRQPKPPPPPHLLDIAAASQSFVKNNVRTYLAEEQRAQVKAQGYRRIIEEGDTRPKTLNPRERARRQLEYEKQRKDVGAFIEGSGNIEVQGDDIGSVKARVDTNPAMQKLARDFRYDIEHQRQRLNEHLKGIDEGDYLAYLEDYLPHFYVQNERYAEALSRFKKESPNAKARTIPSLPEARRMGFHPISQDPAVLYELYSRINWRVATNRRLVGEIGQLRTPDDQPVIQPKGPGAPRNWIPLERQTMWQKIWARQLTEAEGKTLLWKGDVVVHPDVYYAIRQVLDKPISPPGAVYDWFNSFTRGTAFMLSGFHDVSLAFAALGTQFRFSHPNPFRGLVRLFERDPVSGLRKPFQFGPQAGRKLLQVEDAVADAAQHGLRFAWTDSALFEYSSRHAVDQTVQWAEKLPGIRNHRGFTRAIRDLHKWRHENLWSKTHDAMKIMAYHDIVTKALPRSKVPTSVLKERVASYLNDAFGGQDWQTQFWNDPFHRRLWGRFILAPDWTLSTIRSIPFASDLATLLRTKTPRFTLEGGLPRRTQGPLPGLYEGLPGNLMRLKFWGAEVAAVALTSMAIQYAIANVFGDPEQGDHLSMLDNEPGADLVSDTRYNVDVTPIMRMLEKNGIIQALQHVPIVRNIVPEDKAPVRQYMNMGKRAAEVFRWFINPMENIQAKLSRPVAEAVKQLSGREGQFAADWEREHTTPEAVLRLKSIAKSAIPFVFTGNQFLLTQPLKKGMTRFKAQEAFEAIYEIKADPSAGMRWLRSWGRRPWPFAITDGDIESMLEQVSEAAERNGVRPDDPQGKALDKIKGYHLSAFSKAKFRYDQLVDEGGDKRDIAEAEQEMEDQWRYVERLGVTGRGVRQSIKGQYKQHMPPLPADVTQPAP